MAKDTRDRVIDQEITRIYQRDGHVKPSIVVQEAQPKDSLLHGYFEWNNKEAANQHRLWQARHLIRVARIVNEDGQQEQLAHVPVVKNEDDSREGEYKSPSAIVQSVDEYERAMSMAAAKLHGAKRAVQELEAAAGRKAEPEGLLARVSLAGKSIDTALQALQAS